MQAFWQQDAAGYKGSHFDIEPSWMWPKPVQSPYPELSLAGSGPNILKRAVKLTGGWMPVFAMQWDDSLVGKQSRLESLSDDQATLRELEDKSGKPRTKISAMGLPPTPEYIDYLSEHEVDRMILTAPNDSAEATDQYLEQYATATAAYR